MDYSDLWTISRTLVIYVQQAHMDNKDIWTPMTYGQQGHMENKDIW